MISKSHTFSLSIHSFIITMIHISAIIIIVLSKHSRDIVEQKQ